jgi:hypothetical protein
VKPTDEGVPVDELIAVIKESVKEAGVSQASKTTDLRVGKVRLTLEVVASKAVGGTLNFTIPVIGMKLSTGAKLTRKNTHTIDIALEPPKGPVGRPIRGPEVADVLVKAIDTIRSVMAAAAGGDDPWMLATGDVDITFAVTRTGTISLGFDGELEDEVTHTLRLSLVPGTP